MKLSIIIPVYNVESYIDECLHSVTSQKDLKDNYEIIIVNDGTLDNSMEIVDCYRRKCNNIKVIHQKNSGLSIARNTGLKHASGEYIWFVDSDDWIVEDAISYLHPLLCKGADVLAFPLNLVRNTSECNDLNINQCYQLSGSAYLYKKFPYGATPRFIMKRAFLMENVLSFYPGIYHEDAEFGIRMLYQADFVHVSDRSIYNYRKREDGSIMSSWKVKRLYDLVKIAHLLIDFRKQRVPKAEYYNFNQLILWIYISALRFSKGHYNDKTFLSFYQSYKKEISRNAVFLLTLCPFRLKGIAMGVLLSASPLLFVKLHNKLIK